PLLERVEAEPLDPSEILEHEGPSSEPGGGGRLAQEFPDAGTGFLDRRASGATVEGAHPEIDRYVAAAETLAGHLDAQIGLILTDDAERMIGRVLSGNLDEAGY